MCPIYGSFFFAKKKAVTGIWYLNKLELFRIPQLQQDTEVAEILFQQDALHRITTAGSHLSLMPHSPTSELAEVELSSGRHGHLTPHHLIFISGAYVKDKIYVPSLQQSLRELRDRIRDAEISVDEDMLRRVCDEIAII
jgi:hypothetical protein